MRLHISLFIALSTLLGSCVATPVPSPDFPENTWQDYSQTVDPYILWTGDTLDISVSTAPELSRADVIIAPDGKVQIPFVGTVQAAGRTVDGLQAEITEGLRGELRDPRVFVAATEFASQQVFISGQVAQPGIQPLPGQIGPLQAITMAGGFTNAANPEQVIIMRRLPNGEMKSAIYNIKDGITDPRIATWGPLQRFDIIHVSPKWIAVENLFVEQYFRNSLPVDFSLFFDVTGGGLF